MKRKKKLSIILILLLILTCFASCAGQQAEKGEVIEGNSYNEEVIEETVDTSEEGEKIEENKSSERKEEASPPVKTETLKVQKASGTVCNTERKEKETHQCTFSITCKTVFDHLDTLEPAKRKILPADGIIYTPKVLNFSKGDSVFDLLLRETKAKKIHMEYSSNPTFKSNYIEGINNLYEFDCGPLSGWTYKVNGKTIGYGSSNYILSDGDVVEWIYTCDQGRDVGGLN
ncbi:MAG: DUF4430 domain-containing protein [Anaerovoracaceae bacterium]